MSSGKTQSSSDSQMPASTKAVLLAFSRSAVVILSASSGSMELEMAIASSGMGSVPRWSALPHLRADPIPPRSPAWHRVRKQLRSYRNPARAMTRHDRRQVPGRSEEHTSELQSRFDLVCRLLLEKKKKKEQKHRYMQNL